MEIKITAVEILGKEQSLSTTSNHGPVVEVLRFHVNYVCLSMNSPSFSLKARSLRVVPTWHMARSILVSFILADPTLGPKKVQEPRSEETSRVGCPETRLLDEMSHFPSGFDGTHTSGIPSKHSNPTPTISSLLFGQCCSLAREAKTSTTSSRNGKTKQAHEG